MLSELSLRWTCNRFRPAHAFPSLCQYGLASQVFGKVLSLKLGDVKLLGAAFVVHAADLSENRSLLPALVVDATDRPHTPYRRKIKMWGKTMQSISVWLALFNEWAYQQNHWGPGHPANSGHLDKGRWRAPPLVTMSTPESFWPSTSSRNHVSSLQWSAGTKRDM